MLRISMLAVLIGFGVLLCGCGEEPPPLVPVTGKVLHDGKPVTAASITFHPDAANSYQQDAPTSLLQLDGSYTMKTFPFGEGVPPGDYTVTLTPDAAGRLKQPKYASREKTPWKVTVPETGLSEHTLTVE